MQIRKNLIFAVLIFSFVLSTGLATDRKSGQTKNSIGLYTVENTLGKKVRSVSPFGEYFFFPGNNYIYWLSPDIVTDIKKMTLKKEQAKRTARTGNVKQMFSIMHL